MSVFLIAVVAIWILALGGWFLASKYFRKSDFDRVRSRVLAAPKSQKKSKASNAPKLIQTDSVSGFLVGRWAKKFRLQQRLQELLEQAGLKWKAERVLHCCLGLFLGTFGLSWLLLPSQYHQFSWVPALIAGIAPILYIKRKKKVRLRRFEELFPDSLEFVARSMRAGHAFSVSLEMIHREFQEPLAGEFRRTFEEHNLGLPLEVALQKLAKRIPSLDVHFFVSAVLLQKRTGGNLAEILDKLAYVIRERFKLRGRIRAVSAHGKMTGTALTCIPLAVGAMMFYVNPDYIRFFFTDEIGNYMLAGAAVLQIIGYMIIRKIVNIEV